MGGKALTSLRVTVGGSLGLCSQQPGLEMDTWAHYQPCDQTQSCIAPTYGPSGCVDVSVRAIRVMY